MPIRTPNILMTLGFCQWYKTSNSNPSEFNINSSGIKLICNRLKQKAIEFDQGKQVWVPGVPEFLTEDGSKFSDTESPRFEDVLGSGASQRALSGTGNSLVEEEEEENLDVHFKQKWKDSPLLSLARS